MTTQPSSAIHLTGWLSLLVIAVICIAPTGKGVKDTLYYKYRPANQPYVSPTLTWFFWTAALVLLAVSWYYLLTITSNTHDWVDRLFPNQDHPWDGMLALYLVTVVFIKMWNPFVYWLDDQYIYWQGHSTAAGVEREFASGSEVRSRAANRYAVVNAKENPVGADDVPSFMEKQELYFANNRVVQWGMCLYALAIVALTVTIVAFYSRLYSEQKNDQWFKVIYWTVFVSFLVAVFGALYAFFTAFWFRNKAERQADIAAIITQRNRENQAS
jgi:Zn-dependent protease with chaperone function